MKGNQGFEFSFGWIFSIIVGSIIIFLAIYGTTKLINTERTSQDSFAAEQLRTLLNPLESSLESGSKPSSLKFSVPTRIYSKCSSEGIFGLQEISISQKSGIGSAWQSPGVPTKMKNRYIFSEKINEGEEFHLFVKPFQFPFKVGDLIMLWTGEYCFVTPPTEISEEIQALGFEKEGIKISSKVRECASNTTSVCFGSTGCDINVDLSTQRVTKNKKTIYYEGPLMYGAIFSDTEIYECQVQRLFHRAAELAAIYGAKSALISTSGESCSTTLQPSLAQFETLARNATSRSLDELQLKADSLAQDNDKLICQLWKGESS